MVRPSFSFGNAMPEIAALGGLPPHPVAVPIRWRSGLTSSFMPKMTPFDSPRF